MSRDVYVFVGPSLLLEDARAILHAEYLPPVKMGDVHTLLAKEPRVICILDGYFERVPAVWHKEILYALSLGVRVVGASSMGALRAAELCEFGMEGVGRIFEAYRDGVLTADDEVALVHGSAEENYRGISEPLVNLRAGLARAEALSILSTKECTALVEASRATFYPERSWAAVFKDAEQLGVDPFRIGQLREFVADERPNAKRDDAIAALKYILEHPQRVSAPPSFDFEPTNFWQHLVATTSQQPTTVQEDGVLFSEVRNHARLVVDDYRELLRQTLLMYLAKGEAARLGITITPEQLASAAERFRRHHGLLSAERTHEWLRRNALTHEDFTELCRLDATFDDLIAFYKRSLDGMLTLQLQRSGQYEALARAVAEMQRSAGAGAPGSLFEDEGLKDLDLLEWYTERFRPLHGGLEAHAKERGYASASQFMREISKLYVAERRTV